MKKDTTIILDHVTNAKDEILDAIKVSHPKRGRPKGNINSSRGPSNTRLMKIQRVALISYVYVELHKQPEEVTLADAHHVWYLPEHQAAWDKAARLKNNLRGYKDYTALYAAVRNLVKSKAFNLRKINIV